MTKTMKSAEIKRLFKFVDQNSGFDLLMANLLNEKTINSMNWKGFSKNKEQLTAQLKVYQRLLRVLPVDDRNLMEAMIKVGLHSAIQIASIPKSKFIAEYSALFNDDHELIETTYQKAQAIRSQLLIKHISALQKAEPHTAESKLKLN